MKKWWPPVVVVDSSVLIDFLAATKNRQAIWLKERCDTQRIGFTSLALCEVLKGVRDDQQELKSYHILSRFQIFETGSVQLASFSAQNHRRLRGLGFTVRSTIDCIIATFCIQEGHELLHNDRDFDPFEVHLGLQVFRPPDAVFH
jgi:predicted nucleic acid-binding protein